MMRYLTLRVLFGVAFAGLTLLLVLTHPDPAAALESAREPADCIVRTWGIGEGLPQNTVTAIVQGSDGYLWIGTNSGLVRTDCVNFRVFNRYNTPELRNDRITALHEDADGTLWIGTYGGGLYRRQTGEWTNYTQRENLSNDYVTAIMRAANGVLWIGTEHGLNSLSGGRIDSYTTWHGLAGNFVTSLAEDGAGRVYVGAIDGGVCMFEDADAKDFRSCEEVAAHSVSALCLDGGGRLFVGASDGLYVLNAGVAVHYTREDGLSSRSVAALLADADGDVFIGLAAGGLNKFREGVFAGFDRVHGMPDDPIHALFEDADGNIWAGTATEGLLQIKDPVVYSIASEQGLTPDVVTAVMQASDGNLWVGTADAGLYMVSGSRVMRKVDERDGLKSNHILSLMEDRQGRVWVGTNGGGLSRLGDRGVTTLTSADGLSSDVITAIHQDRSGSIWIGTARGLSRLKDSQIRKYDRTSGLGNTHVRTIFENARGIMFIGTREGLIKFYQNTPLPLYVNEDGTEPDVVSIHEDARGVLWIGTAGNGLIRYEENEVLTYNTRDGLPDDNIFSIAEQDNGDMWLSSYVGVIRVRRAELDSLALRTIPRLTPALYDETEGMRNRQCTYEGEPSACRGREGRLYYPTVEGVAVIDPERLAAGGRPPRVIIEEMVADDTVIKNRGTVLRNNPHVVQFRFTALDFLAPEKIRFQYRLEGFDERWKALNMNSQRTAYYFNLDPGRYVFKVMAAGNEGLWSETAASFDFEIGRPAYRHPLVYVFTAAALAAGAAVVAVSRRKKDAKPEKYSTSALPAERIDEILPKLNRLMEEEKVFLDADLNLQALAKRVGIHYNYLSRIINERFGVSYNDYVNKYRIEEAKRMLADPARRDETILDIAYSTGFYSKSVFNTAFKKLTGMTPSQYRKRQS